MTNLNDEIRKSILTYPGLFHNRLSVLAHIYCVNGTGYTWKEDGGISCDDEFELEDMPWEEFSRNYIKKAALPSKKTPIRGLNMWP